MIETVKATITRGDTVITFEGPQTFVDQQVSRYMGDTRASDGSVHSDMKGRPADLKLNTAIAEKELVLAKKPKGHPETVAVLAFALAEAGKAEFTEEDIRRAYIRADVKPPKVVGQAIRDSKNQCDFIEPGSKRGTYKLSNHGDRTVRFDLPKKE